MFGDREQEMGVLWKDRSRKGQHHIRSKNSPCSTVVKERYEKEGEEVRGERARYRRTQLRENDWASKA